MSEGITSFKGNVADAQIAHRTGYGSRGRPIKLRVNCFEVKALPDFKITQYDVVMTPDVPKTVKRQVWRQFEVEHGASLQSCKVVYDGEKIAFANGHPFGAEKKEYTVNLPDEGSDRGGRPFKIVFTVANNLNLHELGLFLKKKAPVSANILMSIVALNVMIRHSPSLMYANKNASIFPRPTKDDQKMYIGGALELWRGFFSSLRPANGKLIMNFDTTAGAFIIPGDLPAVAASFAKVRDASQLAKLADRPRVELSRFLKGINVSAPLIGGTSPTSKFKIKEMSREAASQKMMTTDDNKKVSVAQYFQSNGYRLQNPNLPCVRLTKRAWYPLELVKVNVGDRFTRKLTPDQISETLKFTTKRPDEKRALISEGVRLLGYNANDVTSAWNFGINQEPMSVNGRILPQPNLLVKDRGMKQITMKTGNGIMDYRGVKFHQPAKIGHWGVIVFDSERGDGRRGSGMPRQDTENLMGQLVRACKDYGMAVANERPPIIYAGNSQEVEPWFKQLYEQLGKQIPALVVCLLPESGPSKYGAIKAFGDLNRGVATQCLRIGKARTGKPAYCANVALKINVKLRGTNTILAPPQLKGVNIASVPTIVFGADVAHPGPGSSAPSIAACVGSFEPTATGYNTEFRAQNSREEIITDLETMSINMIKGYYKQSKQKPARILFFRDGVSEGQFAAVAVREIAALKKACTTIDAAYKPKITYVICAKRHHIRLFPEDGGDKSGNAPAGTVVDDTITHPYNNDFYLLSHAGLLGTSKPTHYNVLLDECNFQPDDLQQLIYSLCYLFPRSTRSVSLCSPAYFADLVATRARAYLPEDDGQTTATGSVSSEQRDRARNDALSIAREKIGKQVHVNLQGSGFFL